MYENYLERAGDTDLFQMALGLTPSWQVPASEFDPDEKRLDIRLDFPRGSTFICPECGQVGLKGEHYPFLTNCLQ